MRRICYGWILATGLGAVFGGCSSDKADSPGVGGSTAGSSAGGSAGSSKGGSAGASAGGSAGAADGGSAGDADGGSAGDAAGGSAGDAAGGSAGDADGGSSGASGGDAGAAGQGGGGGCSAAADDCPSGSYCTAESTCVPGCKDAAACASGVCGPTHDCDRCLADSECAAGRQCATGVCNTPCSESEPASCGGGRTCCGTRCVDITHDIGHCGACGEACDPQEFCGTNGCLTAIVANVCNVARATALLDGEAADDLSSAAALTALEQGCLPTPPTTLAVSQTLAEQINTMTGQVVTSGGELLVFAGGPFFNTGINYLEAQRSTPVYSGGDFPEIAFYRTSDDSVIVTRPAAADSHDIIVIQVGREPVTGTPSLILYGFHQNGTAAAVWYFANVMLQDLPTYTAGYYVYEWTDADADYTGDLGEFVLQGSGP